MGWRKQQGEDDPQRRAPLVGQPKVLTIFGVDYHLYDFVFLETKDGDRSEIAQVRQFSEQEGKFKALVMPYDRESSTVAFSEVRVTSLVCTHALSHYLLPAQTEYDQRRQVGAGLKNSRPRQGGVRGAFSWTIARGFDALLYGSVT